MLNVSQKITTYLWFDDNAEEAARLYASIFPDSRVVDVTRKEDGTAFVVTFELAGQQFIGLNGGPQFRFTEAASLFVTCDSQEEVDEYWDRLTADGGEESQCGWLKDKFGLSWQIIPTALTECLSDPDPERSNRAMQAMLGMRKIDIKELYAARDGG